MRTLAERLWAKVDVRGEDECWPWLGSRTWQGYGHLGRGGRGTGNVHAHRAAFEVTFGSVSGLHVCHVCDNRLCCNPAHLFSGTAKDNALDMVKKMRSPRQRLSVSQVREIRALGTTGLSFTEIGSQFGISRVQVRNIVDRRHWTWVT